MKIIFIFILLLCSSCKTNKDNHTILYDKYSNNNRILFERNKKNDKKVIREIAIRYSKVPNVFGHIINNLNNNINAPINIISNVFQGNFKDALLVSWRFFINSTIGLFGILDFASKFGAKVDKKQGIEPLMQFYNPNNGNYLILPLAGTTTTRKILSNIISVPLSIFINPFGFGSELILSIKTMANIDNLLKKRYNFDKLISETYDFSLDPYYEFKEIYRNSINK